MLLLINGLYCIIMATLDEMISFLDTASFLRNPFAIFKAQKKNPRRAEEIQYVTKSF